MCVRLCARVERESKLNPETSQREKHSQAKSSWTSRKKKSSNTQANPGTTHVTQARNKIYLSKMAASIDAE